MIVDYKRKIAVTIIIATIIRCLLAMCINLGNDEAYYYTYALQPDYNYFDHPPFIAYCIRFSTLNLFWVNDFSVRIISIVSAALCSFILAKCTLLISNKPLAAYYTVLLYQAIIYTSIICGVFILPDAPQMIFWSLSFLFMLKIISTKIPKPYTILFLGIAIGIAMLCKIHAAFLWVGFILYIFFYKRSLLKNWYLYAGILITTVIISPVIIWNINNGFATWNFHSNRVGVGVSVNFSSLLQAIGGLIFYGNPFYIILIIMSFYHYKIVMHKAYYRLLCFVGLPIIFCTILLSLFRPTLPHWGGPGIMTLIPLASIFIATSDNKKRVSKKLLSAAIAMILIIVLIAPLVINFYPGTIGKKKGYAMGSGDITLDMYGWDEINRWVTSQRNYDIKHHIMDYNAPLIVNRWYPAGQYAFYLTKKVPLRIVGIGQLNDIHQFYWLNKKFGGIKKGENAYFISVSNYYQSPIDIYKPYFERIEKPRILIQKRNGIPVRLIYLYKCIQAKKGIETFTP